MKKRARVRKKVWGVLVVCNTTKELHLDVVEDYSTEKILYVVRRLVAEKGQVLKIISHPRTKLKGASKEL